MSSDLSAPLAVDRLRITILVDNVYDSLMVDTGPASRTRMAGVPRVPSAQFVEGSTTCGPRAEHGFSALVTIGSGGSSRCLLLDTGISPDGVTANADTIGVDLSTIEAVVLSHGHFDHTGGLAAVAGRHAAPGRAGLPLVLHPGAWSRRRTIGRGGSIRELPTLSRPAVEELGYAIAERTGPSFLLDHQVLVTGQIGRDTEYERGMPNQEALRGGRWEPDPLLLDDQAIVVNVRGRGLVVLTGCGHSGAVNTLRHAIRLTGVGRVHALIGGLHLSGPAFEPIVEPTVADLAEISPEVLVPAHCTGWFAQHRLASAFPGAFIPNAVGTSYLFTAG